MIDPDHERLSIRRQCELVSISRASFYRQPAGETPENLELMRLIDEAFTEMPWYGSRQMARHLRRQGWCVGRKRVRRLMRKIGLSPIYQAPKTSEPHPQHRIYPYLLRHLNIERPDHVSFPVKQAFQKQNFRRRVGGTRSGSDRRANRGDAPRCTRASTSTRPRARRRGG